MGDLYPNTLEWMNEGKWNGINNANDVKNAYDRGWFDYYQNKQINLIAHADGYSTSYYHNKEGIEPYENRYTYTLNQRYTDFRIGKDSYMIKQGSYGCG